MVKLIRITKAGLLNFKRSGTLSTAAVLVMVITLSVAASVILLQAALNFSLNQIKDKVDITVYFNPGAPEDKILAVKDSLLSVPEVQSVTYTKAEEALAQFRARHAGDYATIAALNEINQNPLGAYLDVKAKSLSQYDSIAKLLQSGNFLSSDSNSVIDRINYNDNQGVIEKLNSLIKGAERMGFLLTLILIIVSIIITFNTIRLTIFTAREEIGIMRLVGASGSTIHGPFMVEGIIYGLLSAILTLLLFFPITGWLGRNMTGFLGLNLYDYYLANFWQILVILLFFGAALGIVSSFLASRKYLKK